MFCNILKDVDMILNVKKLHWFELDVVVEEVSYHAQSFVWNWNVLGLLQHRMIGLVDRVEQALELVDCKPLWLRNSVEKNLELTFIIVIEEVKFLKLFKSSFFTAIVLMTLR